MAPHLAFPEDVAVDVLLVGAGPAGYMAAVTMARYGVDFRVIDQRAETIQGGQAGGTCRESGGFLKWWSSRENDTRNSGCRFSIIHLVQRHLQDRMSSYWYLTLKSRDLEAFAVAAVLRTSC